MNLYYVAVLCGCVMWSCHAAVYDTAYCSRPLPVGGKYAQPFRFFSASQETAERAATFPSPADLMYW